ncbi:hypothetical protein ACF9IK_20190 [Kitasatospora hibisci]|uniref:hypothetical protein n=1 Tax=Kitasatospora hibisci TaxID=3369522 RepID=UPI0037550D2F
MPPRKAWKLGKCFCCDRWTLVAAGASYGPDAMSLPLCRVGFERAERKRHRAKLRATMGQAEVIAA